MDLWKTVLGRGFVLAVFVLGSAACREDSTDNSIHVTGVTVTHPTSASTPHSGFYGLSPNCVGGDTGTTVQFTATVSPSNATNPKVTWTSSNPTCYTVDQTGLITWLVDGSATITATTADGGYQDSCVINATYTTSCPFVYVGDGQGNFTYLTDLQGPIIGMPEGNLMRQRANLYTDDEVVLDGLKADQDGNYQVKLREVQPEITYLDDATLVTVDVPDGYEVASSSAEQTYGNGYALPHQLYTLKSPKSLIAAQDGNGSNVTSPLRSSDGVPVPAEGVELPSYTLDFGVFDASHAKLLINAWVLFAPYYTSAQFTLPSIQVKDASGNWVQVKTFGLPAGDVKTMVLDLSNLFPTNDHHIRLNLGTRSWVRWVLDSVRLDDSAPVTPQVGSSLLPTSAVLSSPGNATVVPPTFHSRGSVLDDVVMVDPAMVGHGNLTRLGDVYELVTARDDKFVIMGSGDELRMNFAPGSTLAPGFHRIFLLRVKQYYKAFYVDRAVDPLPFTGMSAYPYPVTEHYPDDADHQAYQQNFNTRINP